MKNIKGWYNFILENKELDNLVYRRKGETKKRFIDSMKLFNDLGELKEFVLDNCSEWLDNPVRITRAIESDDKYFHSHPVERYSISNPNDYTIIMDNHPSWKEFPKRGHSFICSLGETHMVNMDKYKYVVIPLNGSEWGVVPKFDIFHSFYKLKDKYRLIMSIDALFINIRKCADVYGINIPDTNLNDIKEGVEKTNKALIEDPDKIKYEYFGHNIHEMVVKKGINLWDMIIDIINPDNGFSLYDIKGLYNNVESLMDKWCSKYSAYEDLLETWTESPCVFIRDDQFSKLKEMLDIKKPIR